jgi:hypothetical protein
LKFPTLTSRLAQSHIKPSLLFFRTSPASRGTSRFLNEARIIPPLSYTTCLEALEQIRETTDALEIHFADEEGDPYAVELAGRVGGYVVGNDSDFVVLNSDGYLGYIPLEELAWHGFPSSASVKEEDDGEFQTVRKPKATRRLLNDPTVGRGIIPPDMEDLTISFNVYSPDALAAYLKIPTTLLPLLGALVGNDFSTLSESSPRNVQSLFFGRQLTPTQRINHVANTIRTILSRSSQKRPKQKHQLGSVMDLIDRSVNALLTRSTILGSGEIDNIVDKIVEATLQYAIPRSEGDVLGQTELWPTGACALHEPELCPFLPMISRMVEASSDEEETDDLQNHTAVRARYLDAYRKGHLSPKIMDTLNSSTFWPRLFLENPDLETVGRSIGRPIREWVYAIIHDAVGLPAPETEDRGSEESPSDSDDELVDVIEADDDSEGGTSGDDPLAPLKGQLQLLHGSDEEGTEPPLSVSSHSHRPLEPPTIIEYIRRGTRVAQEPVIVRPLLHLLGSIHMSESHPKADISKPLLLWPQEHRLTVLLQTLASDVPPIRALPSGHIIVALCLRWVLQTTYARAQESNSKDHDNERWSRREARCFLASFSWTPSLEAVKATVGHEVLPVIDRNIQLMAQTLSALESIEHLSQALLLSEALPSPARLLSGRAFHGHLARSHAAEPDTPSTLWEACSHGLEGVFREERKKRMKKVKDVKGNVTSKTLNNSKKASNRAPSGLFRLLADVEA